MTEVIKNFQVVVDFIAVEHLFEGQLLHEHTVFFSIVEMKVNAFKARELFFNGKQW
jgi:hypothetical protein